MSKGLVKQNLKWAQNLLPACDGDLSHAKRQLVWLKEKVVFDHRGKPYSSLDTLSQEEQERLETYIDQRVNQHKPLQYILGSILILRKTQFFLTHIKRYTTIL